MNKPLLSRLLPGAIAAAVIASTATFVIGPVDLAKVGNGNIAYGEIEPGCLLLTMATSSPGDDLWGASSETGHCGRFVVFLGGGDEDKPLSGNQI